MAKKKQSKKHPKPNKSQPKSKIWLNVISVILVILSVLAMVGSFNTGGSLPVGIYRGFDWVFGWASFAAAFSIIYMVIYRFTREDKKLNIKHLASMDAFLIFLAGFFHVLTVKKDSVTEEVSGGSGGFIGEIVGGTLFSFLDKYPSIILMFGLCFVFFFFAFNLSLTNFINFIRARLFPPRKEDHDLEDLQEKPGFKLNQGVPLEDHNDGSTKTPARLSSFKNTAKQLAGADNQHALTAIKDPDWKYPGLDLLNLKQDKADAGDINQNADIILDTLGNFSINVDMEGANVGPRVTQYTLKPPTGVKLTKITALEDNLALDLAAHSIRIEAPIPGKRLVGIEVPNYKSATVRVGGVLDSDEWKKLNSPLGFVIGKDIAGVPVVADLAKMPHLLVAGQTGSGKSVMINTILTSLLYHNTPSDLKLILVDPKQVELTPYDGIPHLLAPVIHEPEKCISALKWAIAEMERRLKTMAGEGKRNIDEYNNLKKEEGMPYIVIVIDELADLMMVAARDVEALIVRIAQKARASGIHLVLATQRPSVDVITGLIKANVPSRMAFTVASQVDSRTIIDGVGANKLLGQGDMLFKSSVMPNARRIQAAFISEQETAKINEFLKAQRAPQYDDEIISQPVQLNGKGGIITHDNFGGGSADDDLWRDAIQVVIDGRKASTSLLQRRLRVGYARAARLIETMEEQGIVGHADGSRPREVLITSMDDVFGNEDDMPPVGDDVTSPVGDAKDDYLSR
ncbi:MAG: DNA translocase FtsK 4TM domain-containing protein [Patescibacteria group bacterium]